MADLRPAVRRFLNDLEAAQAGLWSVLAEKRLMLQSADVQGLERIAGLEAERVRELQALLARRRGILDQARTADLAAESISELVEQFPSHEQALVRQQVERISTAADEIRRETWVHWIVTRSISTHYSELLELVANCGREAPTYEERPVAHARSGGAILDASV